MSFASQPTAAHSPQVKSLMRLSAVVLLAVVLVILGACSDDPDRADDVLPDESLIASSDPGHDKDTDLVQLDLRLRLEIALAGSSDDLYGQGTGPSDQAEADQLLVRVRQPFLGDLDKIRERRFLRVLVSYGRTNFFFDQGSPRGFEYDLMMEYEKLLNASVSSLEDRIKLIFVPAPFDQLLDRLASGHGDVAAAGLTVTPERLAQVDFTKPYLNAVDEVIVGRQDGQALTSLNDLSGRTVVARQGSSYITHLKSLNERLLSEGRVRVEISEAKEQLSTEDILEMLDAGVIQFAVADRHIATIWSKMLSNIRIYPALVIHQGGKIAWAVRQDNPRLLASLNQFLDKNRKGSLLGNILFTRYYEKNRWITNPISEEDRKRLRHMRGLFERYGQAYDIDWLELVAQAYQESRLDQSVVSSAGAIGVMQLLPSTATDKNVGIPDISTVENNIHAGTKYMAFLREHYFSDPQIHPTAKMDFAWASYNAGPNRIRRLRKKAKERGFNPNRWFGNVEVLAAEKIGRETVDYVRNINKYFVAYKMYFNAQNAN